MHVAVLFVAWLSPFENTASNICIRRNYCGLHTLFAENGKIRLTVNDIYDVLLHIMYVYFSEAFM